ncbi:hypothetical protein VNO80_13289 [Phaseolus coccineus]|uniref:SHSP domain-containing protein n=1 Tax=Phaseolus coccineus TaxID=3886 RepID=A0AAN9N5Y6_PHACN
MNWQDPCSSLLSSELWGPYNNNWIIARRHGDSDDITSSLVHAHVNCHETETTHVFRLDLPGKGNGDSGYSVRDRGVCVGVSRVPIREAVRHLPAAVPPAGGCRADGIGCKLEHGVLTVTVPKVSKSERKNVRQIDVA